MKILLVVSLGVFTFGASAAMDQSLSSMKSSANNQISKSMSGLTEAQSCINDATTVEAFKACNYEAWRSPSLAPQKMEDTKTIKTKKTKTTTY